MYVFALAGWLRFSPWQACGANVPFNPPQEIDGKPNYNMGPVKFATIASVFWGVAGFTRRV